MTAPTLARTGANGHRVYAWEDRELPSVTAILDAGIPKPFLIRWAAKAAAEYAAGNLDELAGMSQGQAIAAIKQAPFTHRDRAAGLGDAVHAIINARVTRATVLPSLPEGVRALEVRPYLRAFEQFADEHRPTWLASEATVFNLTEGYAGTLDALCVVDGLTVLLDVKTGKRVYPEVALQLAAYAHGEFIATPTGQRRPLPEIDAAAVLHLRPGGYELRAVRCDPEVYAAFLAALGVFRWGTNLADGVLGRPLLPPPALDGGAW